MQLDFTAPVGRCKTVRSGLGTRLSLAALEVAAGTLIDTNPDCPRWASLLVDRITVMRDRVQGVSW